MAENGVNSEKWDSPEGVLKMADFLRGRSGMSVRQAVEVGKRVEYFRGEKLVSFLMKHANSAEDLEKNKKTKKTAKYFPTLSSKQDAVQIGFKLLRHGYIHRSERDPENKKNLIPSPDLNFTVDGYYTWMYDGNKTFRNFMTALLIVGFLVITCFPIWPHWAKLGLWYLSVTFLIIIFVVVIVRLTVFFVLWLCGQDFWILPNLFDDNLSVSDSFKPLYSSVRTSSSEKWYRVAGIIATAVFIMWVKNQPTDFDEYMSLTKQFTDDIYSGKLLADMSQQQRDDIDKPKVHIPDLKDLEKEENEQFHLENDEEQQEKEQEEKLNKLMEDKLEQDIKKEEL